MKEYKLLGQEEDNCPWYWKEDTQEARLHRNAEIEHVPVEDYRIGINWMDNESTKKRKRALK